MKAALLIAAVAAGLTASTARAVYIRGAQYAGVTSSGGTVAFTVAPDGRTLGGFTYDMLPIGCGTYSSEGPRYETVPIANDAFSFSGGDNDIAYGGTFTAPQTATGTLTWNGAFCAGNHPVVTWAATTTAPFLADLGVGISGSPDPVVEGGYLTYETTVSNAPIAGAASAAPGVTLTESIPSGTTFVSASPSQGSCSETGDVVECALGAMAAGATATATVVVVAAQPGELTASASVTSAAQDPDASDNTATDETTVEALCRVPNVIGKSLAAAEAAIAAAHCRTGTVARAYSRKVRKGRVVSQRPAAGARLLPDAAVVTLVVSRGPKPKR